MKMRRTVICIICAVLLVCCIEGKKKNPLQPFFAREISGSVKEPSGATYCESSDSLWMICDKPSCHFIYETDFDGNLLHSWKFPKSGHDDLEAVACDSENQLIYIAEEGYMRITSFLLPNLNEPETFQQDDDELNLIQQDYFTIDIDDLRTTDEDNPPGLEGLTWIASSNCFAIANEKEPPLIMTFSLSGELLHTTHVDYADDVSGLAYDHVLDKLWVLSDQNEQVFLTTLEGDHIYDYWDLPMENPEGIAINNTVDPPVMYIVTDPSSPHGKQYISALFEFTKPVVGTGRPFYDKHADPPATVPCDGCDAVWAAIDAIETPFIVSLIESSEFESNKTQTILLSTLLPLSFLFLLALLGLTIILYKKGIISKPRVLRRRPSLEPLAGDTDLFGDGVDDVNVDLHMDVDALHLNRFQLFLSRFRKPKFEVLEGPLDVQDIDDGETIL